MPVDELEVAADAAERLAALVEDKDEGVADPDADRGVAALECGAGAVPGGALLLQLRIPAIVSAQIGRS